MSTLLCETVTGDSMADLLAGRDAAAAEADMVELRLDGVAGLDVAAALRGRTRPVVATCRPVWEGGRFAGDEADRKAVLRQALDEGAEFVDVEWRAGFGDLVGRDPSRIVLSAHDFGGMPVDLLEQVQVMRATGAGTIKVAVTPSSLTDTLALAEVARAGHTVVIGMGDTGVPTRLLAARYGSPWTYAGRAVAPGQIPSARMLDEFRFRQVRRGTRLFGVVSAHAMHSLSPVMHNAAFAKAGLDAVYVPLQPADITDFLTYADAMGIEGASVTIPFKLDALRAATRADTRTTAVGAANTLRRIGPGEWEATNTDIEGFLAPLADAYGAGLRGVRAAVLGAGGSARAVVVALTSQGAAVTVHARRREQADETARVGAGGTAGSWPPAAGSWDLLVNCTPLGGPSARGDSPLPGGPFEGQLVYDLTYGAGDSALVREARAAGCAVLDGLPMLVAQAERQFEWWTGMRPAAGVMMAAARRRLGLESCR